MSVKIKKNVRASAVQYHMKMLGYATRAQIGRLYYGQYKTDGQRKSFQGMADDRLTKLVDLGKLEIIEDTKPAVFRLKGLTGNGNVHALAVTDTLIDILRNYPKTKIQREPILDVSSRPDAFVIIKTRHRNFPLILEVMHTETKERLEDKLKDYETYNGKWFLDRGYSHAGVLVIGDVYLDQDYVRVCKRFDRRVLG
jgi:hypothetical protein